MSLYLEQIRQLVSLQTVDDAIHAIDRELEGAPKEIEQLVARFAEVDERRNKILDKLTHLAEQQRRVSAELEDDGSRIKKSKNKMMQVSNAREYNAMAREMDSMERLNRSREEENSALSAEVTLQNAALDEINVTWSIVKAELDDKQAGLDARLADASFRRTEMDKVRAVTGNEVPRPVLDRYEFIRRRLAHPVIVPVTAGVCAGCCITIPPQTFIELQGGHKILNCPNCQRLIYWSEHFSEVKADAEPAADRNDED